MARIMVSWRGMDVDLEGTFTDKEFSIERAYFLDAQDGNLRYLELSKELLDMVQDDKDEIQEKLKEMGRE